MSDISGAEVPSFIIYGVPFGKLHSQKKKLMQQFVLHSPRTHVITFLKPNILTISFKIKIHL